MFQYVLVRRDDPVPPLSVDAGLDPVLDPEAGSFSLLNLRQVVLELVPAPCSASTRLLVLVSSGPANTAPRQAWRQRCSVYNIYSIYNIYIIYNIYNIYRPATSPPTETRSR